jgi:formylglycine-generating enzyme required for sulfatase activity/serine/threonine protein kinase
MGPFDSSAGIDAGSATTARDALRRAAKAGARLGRRNRAFPGSSMSRPTDDLSALEALFGDWLAQRAGSGEDDLEALCRAHPEHAERLREMKRACELLLACLPAQAAGGAAESFGERLERAHGPDLDPEISLDPSPASAPAADLVGELSQRRLAASRYALEDELARGGMGVILRVFDRDLRRHLAMKVILEGRASAGAPATPATDASRLVRFLEEAQVTGQLDHPGIVPVHELGLDEQGHVFFTMKLVQGRDLKRIFELVFEKREDWNETRALGVIQKACEAVAYAHKKGVIHRDLKPANVMVGNFGEVYVMDWGLARVLGRRDSHDLRLESGIRRAGTPVESTRSDQRGENSGTPLLTRDGDVVGTPAYMPPEQARGEIERLGPRSDVYSLGAMLYHLLARRPPYLPGEPRAGAENVLEQVLRGPPEPLQGLRADVPAELVSICEKAMSRELERRYADTLELANDLRAFLEHRVVLAYETGAWAEARKWVARNKPLAASLAAALVLLVVGLTASLLFKAHADEKALEAAEQAQIAGANARRASEQEQIATTKANDVLSLSAIQELAELVARADALWPARPERLGDYERWLADAAVLVDGRAADPARGVEQHPGLADHERKLAEIRQRAKPQDPARTGHELEGGRTYEFEDAHDRWWHAQLAQLVLDLRGFTDEASGGLDTAGTSPQHGWGVRRRAEFARTIRERSLEGGSAREPWQQATAAIAKNPQYAGLELAPQLGLLPIGEDPDSALWEFADLQTGEPARRNAQGRLEPRDETGLVFVLIPGGRFAMGAQRASPLAPNHDPAALANESPVHEVTLSPYFLSKYEMTQGQWLRFTGANPSGYAPGKRFGDKTSSLSSPVEQISWPECARTLGRLGFALPTEAQWERAARGGTSSVWWTGDDPHTLEGAANLADRYCKQNSGPPSWSYEDWLDDGWTVHATVGSFAANPFGLHDVVGNLLEWCADEYDASAYGRAAETDPAPAAGSEGLRVYRGGAFQGNASVARSAYRGFVAPESPRSDLGVRPARAIERSSQ